MLDQAARQRLKAAITQSGKTAAGISIALGYPKTYVSRLQTGEITNPAPARLEAICNLVETDVNMVLYGTLRPPVPDRPLVPPSTDPAQTTPHAPTQAPPQAPQTLLDGLAKFVRENGLTSAK